jgi:hypothetical protein
MSTVIAENTELLFMDHPLSTKCSQQVTNRTAEKFPSVFWEVKGFVRIKANLVNADAEPVAILDSDYFSKRFSLTRSRYAALQSAFRTRPRIASYQRDRAKDFPT